MARKTIATTVAVCEAAIETADPAIITSVAPIAVMPTRAAEARMARALSRVRNRSVVTATGTSATTRTASATVRASGLVRRTRARVA